MPDRIPCIIFSYIVSKLIHFMHTYTHTHTHIHTHTQIVLSYHHQNTSLANQQYLGFT